MYMSMAMNDTSLHADASNEQVCLLLRQSVAIDFWEGICFGFLGRALFGNHNSYWQNVCMQSPGDHICDVTTYVSDAAVIVVGQHAACCAVKWDPLTQFFSRTSESCHSLDAIPHIAEARTSLEA